MSSKFYLLRLKSIWLMGMGESPTDIISENHFEQISSQIWLLKTFPLPFYVPYILDFYWFITNLKNVKVLILVFELSSQSSFTIISLAKPGL